MDNEMLIQEVFKRKALWDPQTEDYSKREIVNILWNEIAEIFGTNRDTVKKRWKSLRDNYRAQLKKALKSGFSPAVRSSKWALFESMDFLRDKLIGLNDENSSVYRPPEIRMDENSTFSPHYMYLSTDNNALDMPTNMEESLLQETNTTSDRRSHFKKAAKKRKYDAEKKEFLELEREKLKIVKENNELMNDSDYNFLVSFLPHMKAMSEKSKLKFRMEVSRITMEIQHEESTPAQATTPEERATPESTSVNTDEEILHTFEVYTADE